MSFIRPEITDFVSRHQPILLTICGCTLSVLLVWRGLASPSIGSVVLGLGIGSISVALYVAWQQRERFARPVDAPGVVQITEARIAYYGPETGSFVDLDAITRVALIVYPGGSAVWRFEVQGEPPVSIPLAAKGAGDLPDLLSALPGVSLSAALTALDKGRPATVQVWPATRDQSRMTRRVAPPERSV